MWENNAAYSDGGSQATGDPALLYCEAPNVFSDISNLIIAISGFTIINNDSTHKRKAQRLEENFPPASKSLNSFFTYTSPWNLLGLIFF